MWLDVGLAILTGTITSAALTQAAKPLASRLGAVATPKADRWHRGSVPLLGGLAIMATVLLGLLAF
jgi:UDP-N-acetylmuramyl pentapeptide phosphotransferase/UDP-N-acetylglucosamine-1-phosphate transferase